MTKPTKWVCAQRSESSQSAWRNIRSLTTHWEHSGDSDQTGQMPRLIWVFTGRTLILLVLSCRGSSVFEKITGNYLVIRNWSRRAHLACFNSISHQKYRWTYSIHRAWLKLKSFSNCKLGSYLKESSSKVVFHNFWKESCKASLESHVENRHWQNQKFYCS